LQCASERSGANEPTMVTPRLLAARKSETTRVCAT
jgi:hypothetical protein